jgi:hypothetical protein
MDRRSLIEVIVEPMAKNTRGRLKSFKSFKKAAETISALKDIKGRWGHPRISPSNMLKLSKKLLFPRDNKNFQGERIIPQFFK